MSVVPASKASSLQEDPLVPIGSTAAERKAMRRNGIAAPEPELSIGQRILRSPLTYASIVVVLGTVASLIGLYLMMVPDRELPTGTVPGLGHEAIFEANSYALITVIPLVCVFILADRFRTQGFFGRAWIWVLTFAWGAAISTFLSAHFNTLAAQHLSIVGNGDPATGARAAIFVAPFVEEATKATVLFFIAILLRYGYVSRLGSVALAGISAAGFAYVENIIYYGRVYRYAAQTYGQVEPEVAMQQLFFVRGIASFFAHPLFTIMTAFGLIVALRTRSKRVRIIAPLVGFCGAALLHMAWNGFASTMQNPMPLYFFIALPLAIFVLTFTIRGVGRESRLLRARLGDYVLTGWLSEADQDVVSSPMRRLSAIWWSMFEHRVTAFLAPLLIIVMPLLIVLTLVFEWNVIIEYGIRIVALGLVIVVMAAPSPWRDMLRYLRLGTELGYLRDAITRGLVDDGGFAREGQIFAELEALRDRGIDPLGGAVRYPWQWVREFLQQRRQRRRPVGGGQRQGPARVGAGAAQYSAVDPTWAPPG
ncbi:PrsW family intramembrane metalloprotease [Propionibacteriaceae bacterium Y2011]|uniref:PrsW family intramembrane metalloprotease n=1 Tax=Microlunatus sp. Y2014 TaxID=3418488 RepID=UPI003B480A4E